MLSFLGIYPVNSFPLVAALGLALQLPRAIFVPTTFPAHYTFKMHLLNLSPSLDSIFPMFLDDFFVMTTTFDKVLLYPAVAGTMRFGAPHHIAGLSEFISCL